MGVDGKAAEFAEQQYRQGYGSISTIEQVREFHEAYGVAVRNHPTTGITPEERLLRVRLVVEEALEFATAMGCVVEVDAQFEWGVPEAEVSVHPDHPIDLVEAADALADLDYVLCGSALTMGIPHAAVVREVHRSNMSKLGADGKPIYREGDSKVLKGPNYSPPNIAAVLRYGECSWHPGEYHGICSEAVR